jgi:hypothetical protein
MVTVSQIIDMITFVETCCFNFEEIIGFEQEMAGVTART